MWTMKLTEKFRMRKYFDNTGTNVYAARGRGVNNRRNLVVVVAFRPQIEFGSREGYTKSHASNL